jgi:hypothetical protein
MTSFFLLINLLGTIFLPQHSNLSSGKTPNWVKEIAYDETALVDPTQKEVQHLLIDKQANLDCAETYIHTVKRVLEGVLKIYRV